MDLAEREQYRVRLVQESYHYQTEHGSNNIAYAHTRRGLTQAVTEVLMTGVREQDKGLVQMAVKALLLNGELLDYPFGQSELKRILEQDITLD